MSAVVSGSSDFLHSANEKKKKSMHVHHALSSPNLLLIQVRIKFLPIKLTFSVHSLHETIIKKADFGEPQQ